ncbi:MAG TPA: PAS domain S-box protein [Rariglobus sp.]|jgi:PAS domain S-box-containing protein|nr:PAS domain S-box protein [Rariglobus sp.]
MLTLFSILPWLIVAGLAFLLHQSRRLQRRALRETSLTLTRIQQAVESASDAIGIGDFEGNSVYHNHAHMALFGYTVEELNAVTEASPLFADKIIAAEIHASIRSGRSWTGETDIKTKDGRTIPAFVRADIIRDEHGRPVGIFGVFTDITERRRAARLLAEQSQRLELTLQSIGEAVITTNAFGHVSLMNPAAEQLLGCTQGRAAGRPIADLLAPLDERTREPRSVPVLALLKNQKTERSIDAYRLLGSDGRERLIAEIAALIRTPDGVSGAVLALRDVTQERKRTDEAARASKLESLGMLAGGIAHDFGNILTSLIGQIALVQRTPSLPSDANNRLSEIDRLAWRASDLTRQLVTFARDGAPVKKTLMLAPLLREATAVAQGPASLQKTITIAADLWPVDADEIQLMQVFQNLAVNAAQAMPAGGILAVTAENLIPGASRSPVPIDGTWVRITVSDTGTGIRPEHLENIFTPFFTTKKTGTGLGLATTYSIVKKHAGSIRVDSTVGRGTTFEILLPATKTVPPSSPPAMMIG